MKLRFENWYENQMFAYDVEELFRESVICFKSGAYRASVMMAYLGIQTELKSRILNSPVKPDNFNDRLWERIKGDLNDDSNWDNTVFDCVNRIKPDNPFLISDDIRMQYSYWRNIRNDCAHAKSNIISHPHVESIWLFIESNIHKFLVNGGKAGLLEKIKRHYDLRYTPEGQSEEYLVRLIPNTIARREIADFFKEVKLYFDEEFIFLEKDGKTYGFWGRIIFSEQRVLREEFIEFIKNGDSFTLFDFLEVFPEIIQDLLVDEPFVRSLWVEKIWSIFTSYEEIISDVLVKSLEQSKISEGEYEFLSEKLARVNGVPTKIDIALLNKIGYFNQLKKILFDSNELSASYSGINFGNAKWREIDFYLSHSELDIGVVSEINSAFNAASYGVFHDGFEKFVLENATFKQSYKEIALENSLTLNAIFD